METPKTYREKEQELYAAIGYVVSRWASLEFAVLALTAWAMNLELKTAARVTSHFKTFALALDFAQAVCQTKITDRAFLNSLIDMIRETSGDRNFIVHTTVVIHGPSHESGEGPDWDKAFPMVGPSAQSLLAESNPKRQAMGVDEVQNVGADIQHLIELTFDYQQALGSGEALPEKFSKPAPLRRPRLAERRALGDKSLKFPPQSSEG